MADVSEVQTAALAELVSALEKDLVVSMVSRSPMQVHYFEPFLDRYFELKADSLAYFV